MQNIKAIINNHNMNILHQNKGIKDKCNCRNKNYCLLCGKCLSPNIVYQKKHLHSNPTTLTKFTLELQKSHSKILQPHLPLPTTQSFTHEDYANDTELSKEYWDIKRSNFIPKLTCNIVRECPPHCLSKRKCYLRLNEKLEINSCKGNNLLNKRSELINKCRHLNKHTLLRHDSKY